MSAVIGGIKYLRDEVFFVNRSQHSLLNLLKKKKKSDKMLKYWFRRLLLVALITWSATEAAPKSTTSRRSTKNIRVNFFSCSYTKFSALLCK